MCAEMMILVTDFREMNFNKKGFVCVQVLVVRCGGSGWSIFTEDMKATFDGYSF